MKKNTCITIITAICAIAIIAAWYKVNQNIKKDIYPVGNFSDASISDLRGNTHTIELSKQQADTIIEMLRRADMKKDTKMYGLGKCHSININFDLSAAHFLRNDNTKALYYIIQKRTKDGEGYAVNSKELSDYLDDIINKNM